MCNTIVFLVTVDLRPYISPPFNNMAFLTQVAHMLSEHEWIAEDRKFFGQPNTGYDFTANDPVEAGRKIAKLEETKTKLSKNVNMRAMNMLGKAEEQVCVYCLDFVVRCAVHLQVQSYCIFLGTISSFIYLFTYSTCKLPFLFFILSHMPLLSCF